MVNFLRYESLYIALYFQPSFFVYLSALHNDHLPHRELVHTHGTPQTCFHLISFFPFPSLGPLSFCTRSTLHLPLSIFYFAVYILGFQCKWSYVIFEFISFNIMISGDIPLLPDDSGSSFFMAEWYFSVCKYHACFILSSGWWVYMSLLGFIYHDLWPYKHACGCIIVMWYL